MQRSLLAQGVPDEPASLAIATKGFRPFFLLAGAFGAAIVPLWLLVLRGTIRTAPYLEPVSWHAHEMVFGFAVAVLAGFLLTAVGNWTQRETLVGGPLLALAGLWLLGRGVMSFAGSLPRGVPALIDLSFLPLLVVAIARPLVATKSRRNFVMLGALAALFTANVVTHLQGLGILAMGAARCGCLAGIDVVVLVILILAGRIFPMFTRNATGVSSIRSSPALDVLTIASMALFTLVDVFVGDTKIAAIAAAVTGCVAAARTVHWGARHTLRHPLLWILHAGYAWLVVGLLLRALAGFGVVASSFATHALTVGGIGSTTLGMMARVSLGHTGRLLVPSRITTWAFVAISLAAVVRVAGPWLAPSWYFAALVLAGVLWSAAFTAFLVVYAPILFARRVLVTPDSARVP